MVRLSPLKEKQTQEVVVVAVESWFYQLVLKHRDKKQGGGLFFFSYVLSGERRASGWGGVPGDRQGQGSR